MKKIALALALIGCASSAQVMAQSTTYNDNWYVAPSVNGLNFEDKFGLDRNAKGVGLRFGKPVSESFDIQFGGTTSRASKLNRSYRQDSLGVDALFMMSRSAIRPFLSAGIGTQSDRVNYVGVTKKASSPYLGIGAGLQADITDQLAFQGDVGIRKSNLSKTSVFGFGKPVSNYLNLGLVYFFDKTAKPAPVVVQEAPKPEPKVETPPPAPQPKFEKITLSASELFAFNKADLKMPQPSLDKLADAMKSGKFNGAITVNGYTDYLGSDKYNQKLSEKRANAVKAYLVGAGVDAGRINAVGKGEADPKVTCTNKKRKDLIACLEPNRRIEVEEISYQQQVK